MTMSQDLVGEDAMLGRQVHIVDEGAFIFHGPITPTLQEINIGQLLDRLNVSHTAKTAVVSRWQKRALTYGGLHTSSKEIAKRLHAHAVRAGDRVVVLAGNTLEYIELFFAVGGLGAIFTILNPTFTAEEILVAVDFVDPKAIFISDRIGYRSNKDTLAKLAKKREHVSIVVQMGSSQLNSDGLLSWEQFLHGEVEFQAPHDVHELWARANNTDTLCIQFTSGTTGARKAAMLTHRNLINNAFLVGEQLDLTSEDILCCSPPLFHCFGLVCGVLASVTHGSTTIIPSDVFNAESSLNAIMDEHCTVIHAVPTMFQALLDHHSRVGNGDISKFHLRCGIIAGSSLSEKLLQRLNAELGLSGLAYAFGMTELSAVSFMTKPSELSLLDDRSSVGALLPHTSAKVVDEDLKTLPPGSRGELLVSGYPVFKEYYRNAAKTSEALVVDSQGRQWLRTGDTVTLDSSGACRVVGRVKDMIKRGGENIAPRDVEAILEQHPLIAVAAVVGIPDARWGESVGAFVQRQGNGDSAFGTKQLKVWLRSRLAAHKVPEHFFWLGESACAFETLPVNASGKIMKNDLRAYACSELVGRGLGEPIVLSS